MTDLEVEIERVKIRAQLAGMAMQGLLIRGYDVRQETAKEAVWMADALIAELDKEPTHE